MNTAGNNNDVSVKTFNNSCGNIKNLRVFSRKNWNSYVIRTIVFYFFAKIIFSKIIKVCVNILTSTISLTIAPRRHSDKGGFFQEVTKSHLSHFWLGYVNKSFFFIYSDNSGYRLAWCYWNSIQLICYVFIHKSLVGQKIHLKLQRFEGSIIMLQGVSKGRLSPSLL